MKLSDVRELFWPILEKKDESSSTHKPSHPVALKGELSDSDRNLMLELAKREYDEEYERFKNAETKSIIFIGVIGVVFFAIINLMKNIFTSSNSFSPWIGLAMLLVAVVLVYLLMTVKFSVNALERRNVKKLTYPGYALPNDSENYAQLVLTQILECVHYNRTATNEKMDCMVMAQEFFKRAITVAFLLPAIAVIKIVYLFGTSSHSFEKLRVLLGGIDLSLHLLELCFFVSTFNLILLVCLLIKLKPLEGV